MTRLSVHPVRFISRIVTGLILALCLGCEPGGFSGTQEEGVCEENFNFAIFYVQEQKAFTSNAARLAFLDGFLVYQLSELERCRKRNDEAKQNGRLFRF